MALFEFEDGRLLPAQYGRSVRDDVSDELLRSIRDNISHVLERPLFPITWDSLQVESERVVQWMLALDAAGFAVNVEVCARLTADGLVDALARSAEVQSLGWNDLAALYADGPGAFRTRWAEFRGGLPPQPESGPQLTIVAAAVDGAVRPSLDFLSRVGVEVLQLNVRELADGRRFVDVRPLDPVFPLGHNRLVGGRRSQGLLGWANVSHHAASAGEGQGWEHPAEVEYRQADARQAGSGSLPEVASPLNHSARMPQEQELTENVQKGAVEEARLQAEKAEEGGAQPLLQEATPPGGAPQTTQAMAELALNQVAEETVDAEAVAPAVPGPETKEIVAVSGAVRSRRGARPQADPVEELTPQELAEAALLESIAKEAGQGTALYWVVPGRDLPLEPAGFFAAGGIDVGGIVWPTPVLAAPEVGEEQDPWDCWRIGSHRGPSLTEARREIAESSGRRGHGRRAR